MGFLPQTRQLGFHFRDNNRSLKGGRTRSDSYVRNIFLAILQGVHQDMKRTDHILLGTQKGACSNCWGRGKATLD